MVNQRDNELDVGHCIVIFLSHAIPDHSRPIYNINSRPVLATVITGKSTRRYLLTHLNLPLE